MKKELFNFWFICFLMLSFLSSADARDITYSGSEAVIYVIPGQPTQTMFPGKVQGGVKKANSCLGLEKRENYLILFASSCLPAEGESIIVFLEDKRSYSLLVIPANDEHPRDASAKITDTRDSDFSEEESSELALNTTPRARVSASSVVGLVREMVLIAELGKSDSPPGYRRSNRYSGEVVLDDGALRATIDEILVGSNFWGYVLTVVNQLGTTQRLNPATFRLDGTKAIAFERIELAPTPYTSEQQIAEAHQSKVYIVTKRRR